MLNWLTGGVVGAPGGYAAATGNQNQALEHERPQTPPPVAFEEYDDPMQPPQTPAALFAVKAFRTAIFGTPAPKPPRFVRAPQPTEPEQPHFTP
ncbi:hypothetical protein BZA05DRAFT_350562, partial [Tricharina praecox]|uniref:uncharacterized protein n=1 Tax=Tricharina praecox TaxID=43433 RepID=UPI00221EE42A